MDRRGFLKRVGMTPAALRPVVSAGHGLLGWNSGRTPIAGDGDLTLSSPELLWHFDWRDRKLTSTHFENRVSRKTFDLSAVQEVELTFSASKHRVDIPWWRFAYGPDKEATEASQDRGLKLGYHLLEFSDRNWGATENLLLRGLRGVEATADAIAYNGYGWFRREFSLPAESRGEAIVFVLGGYDYHDWKDYWVYLNGLHIGHRESTGQWRTPEQFAVSPQHPAYSSIHFSPDGNNLLAVRTRAYERRFGGFSDEVLRHYVFEPYVVDQFISVGTPYRRVGDFEVRGVTQVSQGEAIFDLQSTSQPVQVSACYRLEGPTRRKWLEIRNPSNEKVTLLDVHLDGFTVGVDTTTHGGHGAPVFAGEEVFCSVEHPAGFNIGDGPRVRMMHFPGRTLNAGGTTKSYVSLVSVAEPGKVLDHFLSYIQERSPRKKKLVSMYDSFGVNNQWGGCPTLDDVEMIEELQRLESWRQQGVAVDYFVADTGWIDHSSDLTQFAPQCFPDGPGDVTQAVNKGGMQFGLWFPVSWGAMSNSENPEVWPDQIPNPGEDVSPGAPPLVYQNGYLQEGGAPARLCIASEPYFTMFQKAIQHHIHENRLKLYKLDGINSYCNSTDHNHLPGKYSVEAVYDQLIEIARSAREAEPDIALLWYWGVRSPFFALHGDAIFESGLYMEGAGTSWFPTLYYRDSVALNLDQSTRFATMVPPINKDSLGVWLADNRWGNFMGSERWREALIMDLGRGNLLFPQLWGDLSLFDEKDVAFLASMQSVVKRNETILLQKRRNFGDPWRNEVYGWAYTKGSRGLVFINNIHFESRKVQLDLRDSLGFEEEQGAALDIYSHFPERNAIRQKNGSEFRSGDRLEFWLRPFEILMLEISPAERATSLASPRRVDVARDLGIRLPLTAVLPAAGMSIEFADAGRFEKEGKKKQVTAFTTELPALDGYPPILAVTVRLRKRGEEWRYSPAVAEIVQVVARIGPEHLVLIPVPDARQFGNTQKAGCSWVVYKARINRKWSHDSVQFAVHSYLPEGVERQVEAWVVQQWWQDNGRPLPDGFYANEPS